MTHQTRRKPVLWRSNVEIKIKINVAHISKTENNNNANIQNNIDNENIKIILNLLSIACPAVQL